MKLKLLMPALLAAASFGTSGFAATISFSGPSLPVIGDPLSFKIFGAQLTQPTLGNSDWVLTIETNYGVTLPGSPNVIPDYTYNQIEYGIGDFLIAWNGNDYGIVLSPHDSYTQEASIRFRDSRLPGRLWGSILRGHPTPFSSRREELHWAADRSAPRRQVTAPAPLCTPLPTISAPPPIFSARVTLPSICRRMFAPMDS